MSDQKWILFVAEGPHPYLQGVYRTTSNNLKASQTGSIQDYEKLNCTCVGYQTQKPPKFQTKQPLYQLQLQEGVTHGRKPKPTAYRGLIKLRVTNKRNRGSN